MEEMYFLVIEVHNDANVSVALKNASDQSEVLGFNFLEHSKAQPLQCMRFGNTNKSFKFNFIAMQLTDVQDK